MTQLTLFHTPVLHFILIAAQSRLLTLIMDQSIIIELSIAEIYISLNYTNICF